MPNGLRPARGDACGGKLRNQIQQPLLLTILFLQGAGEQGSNLDDVKKHAVAKIVEQQATNFTETSIEAIYKNNNLVKQPAKKDFNKHCDSFS